MKIYVFKGENAQWYWHIKSLNGKIICQSEGYKKRSNCLKTIKKLQLKLAKATLTVLDKV